MAAQMAAVKVVQTVGLLVVVKEWKWVGLTGNSEGSVKVACLACDWVLS